MTDKPALGAALMLVAATVGRVQRRLAPERSRRHHHNVGGPGRHGRARHRATLADSRGEGRARDLQGQRHHHRHGRLQRRPIHPGDRADLGPGLADPGLAGARVERGQALAIVSSPDFAAAVAAYRKAEARGGTRSASPTSTSSCSPTTRWPGASLDQARDRPRRGHGGSGGGAVSSSDRSVVDEAAHRRHSRRQVGLGERAR